MPRRRVLLAAPLGLLLVGCGGPSRVHVATRAADRSVQGAPAGGFFSQGAVGDAPAIARCSAAADKVGGATNLAGGFSTTVGAFMTWRRQVQAARAARDPMQPPEAPDYPFTAADRGSGFPLTVCYFDGTFDAPGPPPPAPSAESSFNGYHRARILIDVSDVPRGDVVAGSASDLPAVAPPAPA